MSLGSLRSCGYITRGLGVVPEFRGAGIAGNLSSDTIFNYHCKGL